MHMIYKVIKDIIKRIIFYSEQILILGDEIIYF